jgi:hypothetical protein
MVIGLVGGLELSLSADREVASGVVIGVGGRPSLANLVLSREACSVHPGQISGRSARSSDVREVREVREIHQLNRVVAH